MAIKNSRCRAQLCIFNSAHAITIVTDDAIRMKVLIMPSQMFSSPCGHSAAPVRRMI